MGAFSLIVVINLLNRGGCMGMMFQLRLLKRLHLFSKSKTLFFGNNVYMNKMRSIHMSKCCHHGDSEWQDAVSENDVVNIVYVNRDGSEHRIRGKVGDNVMYLAHRYEIDLEGACEAS